MPKALGDYFWMNAGSKQKRCTAMAKIVAADLLNLGLLAKSLEDEVDAAVFQWHSSLGWKDQIVLLPGLAEQLVRLELGFESLEDLHHVGIDGYRLGVLGVLGGVVIRPSLDMRKMFWRSRTNPP